MNNRLSRLAPGAGAKVAYVFDLLVMAAGLGIASNWAVALAWTNTLSLLAVAFGVWSIMVALLRLYSPYCARSFVDGALLTLISTAAVTTTLFAMDYIALGTPPAHFDPNIFAIVLASGTMLSQLLLLGPLGRRQTPRDDVLIIGTGPLGATTARTLSATRNVIGFLRFDDEPDAPKGCDSPVLGHLSDLNKTLEEVAVDEVYIAGRVMNQGADMQAAVKTLEELGHPFAVPLHSLRYNRAQLLSSSKGRDGYLHYLNTRTQPIQFAIKRMLDVVISACALVALSPLLLATAIIIKITSPGPALFRQKRVGLHGAEFNFLKFRSMCMNADKMKDALLKENERGDGPAFKMKNDPRVTAFGRFIRKFSIDELPQFINVLRGDMTLVGPRPPVPREVAEYKSWQRRRLSVRPGLTCYWQVGGRDEIGFDDWMLLDLRYVDHWTVMRDLALVLKTVPVVLLGKGAS